MKKESIKPFLWGTILGALVLLIVIFSTGWVVTSKSATKAATEMAENAVIDRLVKIGLAQFKQVPNKEEFLKELKQIEYWKRGEFIAAEGWAAMPGETTVDSKVADELAQQLLSSD